MRLLILVPIIHTEQDMGSFNEQAKQEYVHKYGLAKWEQHLEVIHYTQMTRVRLLSM